MPIDVDLARALTPATAAINHLNNAGASLQPQPVLDAVLNHIGLEARIGGYEAANAERDAIESVYADVAELICAHHTEIALFESASAAWDCAFEAMSFRPGDRILTGRSEYVSNAITLLMAHERFGVEIVLVDNDEDGQISLQGLANAVDERTKLIALTHVPTSGGLVNPAAEVGAIARAAGVPFLLDACQSVGQLPLDVNDRGCDMLAVTGRKFLRAPRGTGFLYVRESMLESLVPPRLDGHSATWTGARTYEVVAGARRFELFESSVANRLGLGAAVRHALGWGLADIAERVGSLAAELRLSLASLDRVVVHDRGVLRCGIVTFSVDGIAAGDVMQLLRDRGINTWVVKSTSAQFDLGARGIDEVVRASPHYFNTSGETARLVDAIASIAKLAGRSPH